MRRIVVRAPLVAVTALLTVGVLLSAQAAVHAQDATDPAAIAVVDLAPGVTAEVFAGVPSARAPQQTLYLARFVFQPGGEIFAHAHPGTVSLGVAEGRFGWTLVAGTARVLRGAAHGATGPAEELTTPGAEVILEPGDAISYEDDAVHTARGAGEEPAVVLGTLLLTAGEPLLMPADMHMGTATP